MLGSFRSYSQSPGGRFLLALMFGLLAVSFFIAFGPSGRLFEPTKGADYAAKVNGEVISRVEFERYYYRQVRQFGTSVDQAMLDRYMPRSRVLDELIKDRLLSEAALNAGVDASDRELASLIRQDPDRAEATLEALVDHLRVTLPKLRTDVGNAHSSLADQLEVCRSYLSVMKVRMGERFSFRIEVDAALQQHPFPPLLLISLVENAIKHGIERVTGVGQITVDAAVVSQGGAPQLSVNVIDTGAGLRTTAAMGTGLANIRDQLAARFGPQGSLTLRDRAAGGVIATLRVPYEP